MKKRKSNPVPRNLEETNALYRAKEVVFVFNSNRSGGRDKNPVFNGSGVNPRNRKRPITLAEKA